MENKAQNWSDNFLSIRQYERGKNRMEGDVFEKWNQNRDKWEKLVEKTGGNAFTVLKKDATI